MPDKIHLPRLAVVITTRCNLRCRLCAVGIPTQKNIIHLDVEEVKKSLGACFSFVDFVDSLEFAGGEPFLHSNLHEMIEEFMKWEDRFNNFLIVTNGTVTPSVELLEALRKYKERAVVHISDYGLFPERTKELCDTLSEMGVCYRTDRYWGDSQYQGGWLDPGEVVPHKRSEAELCRVYSECGLVKNGGCWRIHRGKLHFCTRSCRCEDDGLEFECDTVELFRYSAGQKQQKLLSLLDAPHLAACDYCNGDLGTSDKSKRFPAAEQVTI